MKRKNACMCTVLVHFFLAWRHPAPTRLLLSVSFLWFCCAPACGKSGKGMGGGGENCARNPSNQPHSPSPHTHGAHPTPSMHARTHHPAQQSTPARAMATGETNVTAARLVELGGGGETNTERAERVDDVATRRRPPPPLLPPSKRTQTGATFWTKPTGCWYVGRGWGSRVL